MPQGAPHSERVVAATAIRDAVRAIAKKEGRSERLRQAENAKAVNPDDVPGATTESVKGGSTGRTLEDGYFNSYR